MTQKNSLRQNETQTHERYLGSNAFTDMYKQLEHENFSIRVPVTVPAKKFIHREPKGSEEPTKPPKCTRKDPTEYKEAFGQVTQNLQHAAGRPLTHTPIGEW
jgi:hypothetical protein